MVRVVVDGEGGEGGSTYHKCAREIRDQSESKREREREREMRERGDEMRKPSLLETRGKEKNDERTGPSDVREHIIARLIDLSVGACNRSKIRQRPLRSCEVK